MTRGMFSLRAGVCTGRLDAILTRDGSSVRLTVLKCRIIRCLCVLTMRVLMIVRRIVSRERKATTVRIALSKGSMRAAIRRAISGLTPRGANPGSAVPDLWEVDAVAARADSTSLFLEGWNPLRSCSSQERIDSSAEAQQGCSGGSSVAIRGSSLHPTLGFSRNSPTAFRVLSTPPFRVLT